MSVPAASAPPPAVLVVTGPSGSGKTTLVVALVPELSRRGLRVATVKHHAHDDSPFDVPGKDSFRHFEAGASGSAVVTATRVGLQLRLDSPLDPVELAARFFPSADIVLIEGYRDLDVAKIEVRRDGVGDAPLRAASDPRVVALVTTGARPAGVACAVFAPEDVASIATLVETLLVGPRRGATSRREPSISPDDGPEVRSADR